ncbi:defecation cycle abnormal dec-7-like isoform X2 [Convolutriloba macropyga]|uniref:defecation cycle abnormal dec-7-like isoform X2 n=1 Tax=Convolutriloba macropyga TaxID=536237 RepID=UPI003F524F11
MANILRSELTDITYDDKISKRVFGMEDSNQDVNLANNVFMREMNKADMDCADVILRDKSVNVSIDWGFVVTWYKVTSYPGSLEAHNSFQGAIACDLQYTSGGDNMQRCFVVFDFGELQWTITEESTTHAISGFNGGNGKRLSLLFSKTPAVRNLWAYSNVGIDGLWMYELQETDSAPAVELGPVPPDLIELEAVCNGPMVPSVVDSAFELNFRISDCYLPPTEISYQLKLQGQAGTVTQNCDYNVTTRTLSTNGKVALFKHNGPMVVHILVDGLPLIGEKYIFVYATAPNGLLKARYDKDENQVQLSLENCPPNGSFRNLTVTLANGTVIDEDNQLLDPDILNYTYSLDFSFSDHRYEIYFSIKGVNSCESDPIFVDTQKSQDSKVLKNCSQFDLEESRNDYSNCEMMLTKWYPCPQVPRNFDLTNQESISLVTDADWAKLEVSRGMSGWEYDICCDNGTNPEQRDQLFRIGYCWKSNCEHKRSQAGVSPAFCIRSPRLACSALIDSVSQNRMVSNQCCYNAADGFLVHENTNGFIPFMNSGSMQQEVNSMTNLIKHYKSELSPFNLCCFRNSPFAVPPICITHFKKHRPTIVGEYWPRNVILNRGDPHLSTIDGLFYPFMGIGVYTMLITQNELGEEPNDITEIQASMRQLGKGTVFSGIAIRHKFTLVECYMNRQTEELKVSVNKIVKTVGQGLSEYNLAHVEVTESVTSEGIQMVRFGFQQNMMIVEVYAVGILINLKLSVPPTFRNRTRGLMGTYDGDTENDYTAFDGSVMNTTADLQQVHDIFGESWKVSDQRDWLFSTQEFINAIQQDIEDDFGFLPSYEMNFASEDFRNQANITCKGDLACMRDVSLVGNLSIATAFTAFQKDIQTAQLWNEVARLNEESFFAQTPIVRQTDDILEEIEEETKLLIIIMGSLFAFILLIFLSVIIRQGCTQKRTPKVTPQNLNYRFDQTSFNNAFGYIPKFDAQPFDNFYGSQLKW